MSFPRGNLPKERVRELNGFCRSLGIKFGDLGTLDLALHHRSYSNESLDFAHRNNERLEFLGDSVLGMATAAFLYEDMEGNAEGDLARIKAAVVSEETLAPIAVRIGIDRLLVLGRGEEMSGGRQKKAILADAVEAVIGALYLDGGWSAAQKLVLSLIAPEVRAVQENRAHKDYKTLLQEWFQKRSKTVPVYETLGRKGPEHDQTFTVSVRLGDRTFGPAEGKSKKEAEHNAARAAYEELTRGAEV